MALDLPAGEAGPGRVPGDDDRLADRIARLSRVLRERMDDLGIARPRDGTDTPSPADAPLPAGAAAPGQAGAAAALDAAQPHLRGLERRAADLDARWNEWFAAPKDLADARALVRDTRDHLQWLPARTRSLETALSQLSTRPSSGSASDTAPAALLLDIERELADILDRYTDGRAGPDCNEPSPEDGPGDDDSG